MSHNFRLVKLSHKGRVIAVNPDRVNFVEQEQGKPDYTYIRFSGGEGSSYAYIDASLLSKRCLPS